MLTKHYSDSLEDVVIAAAVGSSLGFIAGVKNTYDGLKAATADVVSVR